MGVGQKIIEGTNNIPTQEKKYKLIIHETDCHGCGYVHYKDHTDRYAYDDSDGGDMYAAVKYLIRIGFINEEDVLFFDESNENDIYNFIDGRI